MRCMTRDARCTRSGQHRLQPSPALVEGPLGGLDHLGCCQITPSRSLSCYPCVYSACSER